MSDLEDKQTEKLQKENLIWITEYTSAPLTPTRARHSDSIPQVSDRYQIELVLNSVASLSQQSVYLEFSESYVYMYPVCK